MPTFKELEHDGDEFFEGISNREKVRKQRIVIKADTEKENDEAKKKAQEAWLSTENPFLWDDLDSN